MDIKGERENDLPVTPAKKGFSRRALRSFFDSDGEGRPQPILLHNVGALARRETTFAADALFASLCHTPARGEKGLALFYCSPLRVWLAGERGKGRRNFLLREKERGRQAEERREKGFARARLAFKNF